jgi:hypothetical protein
MHILAWWSKIIFDKLLTHLIPSENSARGLFFKSLEHATTSAAQGKISASASTFRRLISQ